MKETQEGCLSRSITPPRGKFAKQTCSKTKTRHQAGFCFGAAGQIRTATAHSADALYTVMPIPRAALAQRGRQFECQTTIKKNGEEKSSPLFWSCWADSNCRPHPYQGCALPTELQQQSSCPPKGACLATEKGLEPSTSGVTGRRSNRLNHSATAQLVYQMNFDLSTTFFEKPGFFHAPPAFLPFARAKTPQISSGSMAMAPMAEGPRMVWSA